MKEGKQQTRSWLLTKGIVRIFPQNLNSKGDTHVWEEQEERGEEKRAEVSDDDEEAAEDEEEEHLTEGAGETNETESDTQLINNTYDLLLSFSM